MKKGRHPLLTVGDIARLEGVPPRRVTYAIDSYRIAPTQRAGILRLYDESKLEAIRWAMRRIKQKG